MSKPKPPVSVRRTDEQKRAILKEIAERPPNTSMDPILKKHGVAPSSYHQWRKVFSESLDARRPDGSKDTGYPPEFREKVLADYENGTDTLKQVADRHGVSTGTIHQWRVEAKKIPTGYSAQFQEAVVFAVSARKPGETLSTFSHRYKVPVATISRWVRDAAAQSPAPQQTELELLENPASGTAPMETAPDRASKTIALLKERIDRLEDTISILRPLAKLAVKRGLLEL
jgi:transposase-like protein